MWFGSSSSIGSFLPCRRVRSGVAAPEHPRGCLVAPGHHDWHAQSERYGQVSDGLESIQDAGKDSLIRLGVHPMTVYPEGRLPALSWHVKSRGYGLPLFTELPRMSLLGNLPLQPSQVCNFPCVGICRLYNKRASLKEAKRDVNRGFDCFSYLEQGQHRSNRRKGAVETWQKLKPSA